MGYGFDVVRYNPDESNEPWSDCRGPECPQDIFRGKWMMSVILPFIKQRVYPNRYGFVGYYSSKELSDIIQRMTPTYQKLCRRTGSNDDLGSDSDSEEETLFDIKTAVVDYVAQTHCNDDGRSEAYVEMNNTLVYLIHCVEHNCGMYVG